MKLVKLGDLTVRYTALTYAEHVDRPDGVEAIGWGLREGELRGDRIRGTYRACNHPHRRGDDVNVPDIHGMITTDDGAQVAYEIHAYGLLLGGRTTRTVVGSITFRTGASRYAWLNSVFGIVEGGYVRGEDGMLSGTFQAYECVPEA